MRDRITPSSTRVSLNLIDDRVTLIVDELLTDLFLVAFAVWPCTVHNQDKEGSNLARI